MECISIDPFYLSLLSVRITDLYHQDQLCKCLKNITATDLIIASTITLVIITISDGWITILGYRFVFNETISGMAMQITS